jgi:hypothetical protein
LTSEASAPPERRSFHADGSVVRTRTRARTPFCPARPQVFKQYLGQVGFISYFSCLFVATVAMLYLRCLLPLPPRDQPAAALPWATPALGYACPGPRSP